MHRVFAGALAGLAGGIAWFAALLVFFGPAQSILSDPARQSAKFLAVFSTIEPLPRAAAAPWIVPLGLLAIGVVHGLVYARLEPVFSGGGLRKGLAFGVVAWALMAPWFEFYLPWNVMHEPMALVLLELVLWLLVLLVAGMTIGLVFGFLSRRRAANSVAGASPAA